MKMSGLDLDHLYQIFLPVMGPSKKHKNVFYCFGHHHLGWTLGPISGKIVSGMIANENTNLDLKAL